MRNLSALAASIFLAFGCAGHGVSDETSQLDAALADQRAENARHERACELAVSMPDVLSDLSQHVQTMYSHMERMNHSMGEMSSCVSGESSRFAGELSNLRIELDDHVSRLSAAPDLAAAHHECIRHAPMMSEALNAMRTELRRTSCWMMDH